MPVSTDQGHADGDRRRLRRQDPHLPRAARRAALARRPASREDDDDPRRGLRGHRPDLRLLHPRQARRQAGRHARRRRGVPGLRGRRLPRLARRRRHERRSSRRTTSRTSTIDGYDVVVNKPKTAAYRAPGTPAGGVRRRVGHRRAGRAARHRPARLPPQERRQRRHARPRRPRCPAHRQRRVHARRCRTRPHYKLAARGREPRPRHRHRASGATAACESSVQRQRQRRRHRQPRRRARRHRRHARLARDAARRDARHRRPRTCSRRSSTPTPSASPTSPAAAASPSPAAGPCYEARPWSIQRADDASAPPRSGSATRERRRLRGRRASRPEGRRGKERCTLQASSRRSCRAPAARSTAGANVDRTRHRAPRFAGHIVDVEVDPDTGKVDDPALHRRAGRRHGDPPVATSRARSRAASPRASAWALNEEYFYDDDGRMTNAQLPRLPHADRARPADDRHGPRRGAEPRPPLRRPRRRRGADRAAARRRSPTPSTAPSASA